MNVQSLKSTKCGSPRRILLAEDDAAMRALLADSLRSRGHHVTECSDGAQLLLQLHPLIEGYGQLDFDLIISDIRMPGITGMEILEGLGPDRAGPPIILITAFGSQETHEAAQRCGVMAFFDKPFEINALLAVVAEWSTPVPS